MKERVKHHVEVFNADGAGSKLSVSLANEPQLIFLIIYNAIPKLEKN